MAKKQRKQQTVRMRRCDYSTIYTVPSYAWQALIGGTWLESRRNMTKGGALLSGNAWARRMGYKVAWE